MKTGLTGVLIFFLLALSPAFAAPENVSIKTADGFDYPVGKPDAHGYHKARGFTPGGHLGEDWDGNGGGDTDLGDPVYSVANGIVVFAADCFLGWGNVVIVRHMFYENGQLTGVDSLYGHLDKIMVKPGDTLVRGQQVGTIGTAHGIYPAHLHFEMRKNLNIGMNRMAFAPDFSNYYDPTQFIEAHRRFAWGPETAFIAINTFSHPPDHYSGPSGARYATYKYTGGSESGPGTPVSETVEFSFSSGDEPISVKLKPRASAKKTPFKVNRYDDIPLKSP